MFYDYHSDEWIYVFMIKSKMNLLIFQQSFCFCQAKTAKQTLLSG